MNIPMRRNGAIFTALALIFLLPSLARAGLTFELHLVRFESGQLYKFFTPLDTNSIGSTPAQGTYIIYSPQYLTSTNGAFRAITVDATGANTVDGNEITYSDFNSVMQQITNGTWSMLFTNATATNEYTFTVSAPNILSNMLPQTIITFPANDSINIPNQPTITWQAPNWPVLTTNTFLFNRDFSFLQFADDLPSSQNNWTVPVSIPNGLNLTFDLDYATNNTTVLLIATTPLNTNASHQPISGWVSTDYLESGDSVTFAVTNPPVATPVLVARYTFDNPGNIGQDSSGNGYDLTFNSGVFTTGDAKSGEAAVFNGNSFLSYNSPPTNILQALAGDFSLSFWIKISQDGFNEDGFAFEGEGIVAADVPGTADDIIPAALDGGEIGFNTGSQFGDDTLNSSTDLSLNTYHHIVVTRTEATGLKQIFIDGQLNNSEIGTMNPLSDPRQLAIGCAIDASQENPNNLNPNNFLVGQLDELQIYAGVLSSNQVIALLDNPGLALGTPSANALVAHYTFDDSDNIGADSSGNGNDLTFNSGVLATFGANAKAGNAAANFNGNSFLSYNSTPPAILNAFADSFSVSFWIKTIENDHNPTEGAFSGDGLVAADVPGVANDYVVALDGGLIGINTGGQFGDDTLNSASFVSDNVYHHVVVTRNQNTGEKRIYIDGALDDNDFAGTDLLNAPQLVAVGASIDASQSDPNNASPTRFFLGVMDDLQIYDAVLSQNQISQLFNNPGATATFPSTDFNPALNTTNLAWITSGDSPFVTQTANTIDGLAVQSGPVTNGQSSILSVMVTGPGTLTFSWASIANDPNQEFDFEFTIDGTDENDLFGDHGFSQDGPYSIGSGQHTLAWTAIANGDTDPTEAGYLDQVTFLADTAPTITLNPFDQTNHPGYPVWLNAAALGNPPPTWQWFEVGSGMINGATSSYFQPTNAGTPAVAGSYYAIASTSTGSSITTTAAVSFVSAPLPPDWSIAFKSPFETANDEAITKDFYYGCVVDPSSNVYTAAEFGGAMTFGSENLNSGPGGDAAAITKQGPTGTPLWAEAITNNGGGNSFADSVALAPGGGIYVSGDYNGANWLGATPLTDAGGGDIFLAYFLGNGTNVWVKTFGGTNEDFTLINCLAADTNGNVTLMGLLGSGPVTIGGSNYNITGQEGLIVQVSQTGAIRWSEVVPEFPQYVVYNSGRLYMSLNTETSGGVTNIVIGGISNLTDRAWAVACLDNNTGQAIWVRGVGARNGSGNGNPFATGLQDDVPRLATSGSNVFVTGVAYDSSAEFGDLTVNFAQPRGQYFARYDTNGNPQVATTYGSVTTTPIAAVANASGDVYVSGDFQDFSFFGSDMLGAPSNPPVFVGQFSQGFVAKFDRNGNPLWAREAVGPWNLSFLGIGLAADGVWASGWGVGTNSVSAQYVAFGTNRVFSDPLFLVGGAGGGVLILWYPGGMLGKITDVSAVPQSLSLTNPRDNGTNFLVTFQTQSGFTHAVEYRTNLTAGLNWQAYTNVAGDGTVQTVPIPLSVFSPAKQGFVRVLTQ